MRKTTIIQIIIIIILVIILGILIKFTIDAINENNVPHVANQDVQQMNGDPQGNLDDKSSSIEYNGATEIVEDTTIESGEYSSETADENAILVNGDIDVDISNVEVVKTGDSDGGDNTSFYGTNSGILSKSGANVTLKI